MLGCKIERLLDKQCKRKFDIFRKLQKKIKFRLTSILHKPFQIKQILNGPCKLAKIFCRRLLGNEEKMTKDFLHSNVGCCGNLELTSQTYLHINNFQG